MPILPQSTLLALQTACSNWPSGSPGVTATVLPSRSLGVLIPDSASETTEKPVGLTSTTPPLTPDPLAASRTPNDDSPTPTGSGPAPPPCPASPDPGPPWRGR